MNFGERTCINSDCSVRAHATQCATWNKLRDTDDIKDLLVRHTRSVFCISPGEGEEGAEYSAESLGTVGYEVSSVGSGESETDGEKSKRDGLHAQMYLPDSLHLAPSHLVLSGVV